MLRQIRPALVMLGLMTVLLGIAYPLATTGIAGLIFRDQAGGSLVRVGDKVVGSALLAQAFTGDKYFHPRPSAAGEKGFDAASSSGSNLGPTSKALNERVKGDVATLRKETTAPIPADLVTASGSGLDPHISPAAAMLQAPRVAKARGLPEERVRALIEARIEGRLLGLIGEPRVNVLLLNLALDEAGPKASGGPATK
ncbi:MAG: potassium-transporting ATPase subunit KdpC [Reyranellaceae bacterium]